MTEHPITPPPELVKKIFGDALQGNSGQHYGDALVHTAYAAGADRELEACCEWFVRDWADIETADKLRAARRPKPPSLKEQALEALERIDQLPTTEDKSTIRRALEALDD